MVWNLILCKDETKINLVSECETVWRRRRRVPDPNNMVSNMLEALLWNRHVLLPMEHAHWWLLMM